MEKDNSNDCYAGKQSSRVSPVRSQNVRPILLRIDHRSLGSAATTRNSQGKLQLSRLPARSPDSCRAPTCSKPAVSQANGFLGAKLGANCARHQATLGDVRPELPQFNGTLGHTWRRPAMG
jgi:hypothetical protein